MRRILVPIVLALVVPACSPAAAPRLEPLRPGAGPTAEVPLRIASARQAVDDFLRAYAMSGDDRGATLANYVGGSLQRWAYWLGVQNANLPGTHSGSAKIRNIRFVRFVTLSDGTEGAILDVDATVSLTNTSPQGEAIHTDHIFDGPAELVGRGSGTWTVVDIARDGELLSDAMGYFDSAGATRSAASVTARLDSLFRFSGVWEFNVSVTNEGDRAIAVSSDATTIASGPESPERVHPAWVSGNLNRIPPGERVDGILNFPASEQLGDNLLFTLEVRRSGDQPVRLPFRLSLARPNQSSPSPTAAVPVQ